MLGVLKLQPRFGHRQLRRVQVGLGVARRPYPGRDFAPRALGLGHPFAGVVQALLIGEDLDEPGGRSARYIDAGLLHPLRLLANLGIAQRLAGSALAAQLDHAADAQRGLGGVRAAQAAAAGKVLELAAHDVGRRQGISGAPGPDGLELRRLHGDGGVCGQGAGNRLGKTKGFGGLAQWDQAARPGERQDKQVTQFHGKPPGSTDDRERAASGRPSVDQAMGGRKGVAGMPSRGAAAPGNGGASAGGMASATAQEEASAAVAPHSAWCIRPWKPLVWSGSVAGSWSAWSCPWFASAAASTACSTSWIPPICSTIGLVMMLRRSSIRALMRRNRRQWADKGRITLA